MEKKEGDKSNRRSLRDPSCSKNYSEFDYDSNCEESRFEKMANYLEDSGDDRNYEPDLKRSRKDSSSDISSDENNSIQNGNLMLELENQDIVQLVLNVTSDDNHGLIKNSQTIDMHLGLCIVEYLE